MKAKTKEEQIESLELQKLKAVAADLKSSIQKKINALKSDIVTK